VVTVPVPLKPLPIGVQIITAPWREDMALAVQESWSRPASPSPRNRTYRNFHSMQMRRLNNP